ncbi:MAG: penicillin-binding protein 2 [Gemmatimonadales bacterium]
MSSFTSERLRERTTRIRAILLGAFLLLAAAFFRAQVVEVSGYRLQSAKNRLRQVPLLAPRGEILDREGRVIADNVPGYTVKLFAPSADSLRAVLRRIATLVPLDSGAMETIVRRFQGARYQPALVFSGARFEAVSRLEENRYLLPGLVVQTEPRRVYTGGPAVAHLVGYVGEVSEEELKRGRFLGARMGSIIGRDGLEQQYDSVLRGIDGIRYTEVDARGRMVREEVATGSLPPIRGLPIKTSIDLSLQLFVDSLWRAALPDTRGAIMAMTPTGEVLALYSAPTFDPNDFIGGIDPTRWAELNTDSARPLLNRALRGTYPPASTFKLALAVMALRRGVADFDTQMPQPCRGGYQFGNRFFRCWKREGHGTLSLMGAIRHSCDTYFYQLGLRLGLPYFLEEGTRLGFSERTGIDLGSESRSFFPPNTAYYDRVRGPRGWTNAVTLNLAIGQGENAQSLVNLMRFYAALAGDGQLRQPYLVQQIPDRSPISLGLVPHQLEGIRTSLAEVVRAGTAAASGGQEINVAGKTGTAQNPHGKDHGWFIGFAPADNPRVVVGAIMEFKEHGSSVAPYVVQVIRRYLAERDPALARARLRFPVVEDSVPRPTDIGPDTVAPDTGRLGSSTARRLGGPADQRRDRP